MKNAVLLGVSVLFLFLLFGCATPKYQFCCAYEQAFPEDPNDAVCWGFDEEGVEQELPVMFCDEDDYSCTILNDEGEEEEIPVCAYMETVPCETSCAGVFCGQFFYDPRPSMGLVPDNQSHSRNFDGDEGRTGSDIEDPIGMWNAQCKVEQMTPVFIRQVDNSDNIVLNTFRFGIGDSFEDFEEAQYYFPLTDEGCYLNSRGSVDRYVVYAIPNSVDGSGALCTYSGGSHTYTCSKDSGIESYSYFDCASRCALDYYGYDAEIDPLNPYVSLRAGSSRPTGNPFSYAPGEYYDFYDSDPRLVPCSSCSGGETGIGTIISDDDVRSTVRKGGLAVVSGEAVLIDEYPTGTLLYGATFGYEKLSTHEDEDLFLQLKEDEGDTLVPAFTAATMSPGYEAYYGSRYGEDLSHYLFFDWEGRSDSWARTVFFTQMEDSHAIYPWLLAHHSVYNKQFEEGHYLADGTREEGAEYECLSSSECLSGYCNNFDYKRGVCVDVEGNDVLCDCISETGQVLCTGAAAVDVPSWDQDGADVEMPFALPALIDDRQASNGLVSLPSVGRVQVITITEDGDQDDDPIDGVDSPVPMFFMYVGGMGLEYKDFDSDYKLSPDYEYRSWGEVPEYDGDGDHDGDISQIDVFMNPCAMLPKGSWSWWNINWSGEVYTECCGGTTSCCTAANGYDSEDDDHHCEGYPFAPNSEFLTAPEAGTYATRFMENCMQGYEKYVHLCYGDDAHDEVGNFWGWDLGSATELELALEAGSKYDSFCEYLANMRDKNDKKADGYVTCYLWQSGGYTPISDSDKCVMEAETFIAIEPRWVEEADEGAGRWAFGKCMLNTQGDDLEVREYGMCESCGFLTMAKQELSAIVGGYLDPDTGDFWEGLFDDQKDMYSNTYCPDLTISTPYTYDSFHSIWAPSGEGEYSTMFFYGLDAFGMNGYNKFLFGNSVWGSSSNHNLDVCTYPNGYTVYSDHDNDWEAPNRQRGLPYTYPNAYYVNSQLEEMMKRNIQPVLFAADWYLWEGVSGKEFGSVEDDFSVALKVKDNGEIKWATSELIADLYLDRNYLFIGNSDIDPENENVIYSAGSFLANTVLNEGAVILVTYLGERESSGVDCSSTDCEIFPRYNHDEIIYRGRATRLLCPNCMIAVGAGYDGGYQQGRNYDTGYTSGSVVYGNPLGADLGDGFNLDNRKKEITALFEDEATLDFVDAVALNVQLAYGDDYCSMGFDTEEEKFAYIISELQELGRWSLATYGKPLIITDLKIDYVKNTAACWDDAAAGRFLAYIGENANELAKAGYLGVIYGSWDSSQGTGGVRETNYAGVESYRGDFFEGVFAAARNFAGHSFTVYYSEATVGDASTCPCIPCTQADDPALCNGYFQGDSSMPRCVGYQAGMKWPDNCVSEDVCVFPEADSGAQVECTAMYNNGTTTKIAFEMDDIVRNPSAYQDVIGSINSPEKYCFSLSEGGNAVTYFVSDQVSFDSTPAVFSLEGDTEVECDPTESLLEPFCGYVPPVTDYKLVCEVLP